MSELWHGVRLLSLYGRDLLRYAERHSGVPAVILLAIALVVSYRIAKKTARFAVEVVVATVLVFTLTRLGVLCF